MSPLTVYTSDTVKTNRSKSTTGTGTSQEDTYYQRIAISQVFSNLLSSHPEEENLITVAKIKMLFPVYSRCTIQHVIKETRTQDLNQKMYNGHQNPRKFKQSIYGQIVVDFIKNELG